jgi:hypothetical protein
MENAMQCNLGRSFKAKSLQLSIPSDVDGDITIYRPKGVYTGENRPLPLYHRLRRKEDLPRQVQTKKTVNFRGKESPRSQPETRPKSPLSISDSFDNLIAEIGKEIDDILEHNA